MVDFAPDPEVQMMKKSLDQFLKEEVRPLEEEHRDLFSPDYHRLRADGRLKPEALEVLQTIRRRSGDAGFYGVAMPENVGGGGLSTVQLARLIEHLYSRGLGLNIHVIESVAGPHPTFLSLSPALQEEYLKPNLRGRKTACFALTESSSGSDALNMTTRARQKNGDWVINGRKMWITNGPYADFGQVFAVSDPGAEGARRVSAFLFQTDQPGFRVNRVNRTLFNDGMQAEVEFDGLRVPPEHLVGERGEGFYGAMETIGQGRVRIGARCVGLMQYLLEQVTEYANDRTSWGKPIGTRQHVRGKVAEIATWVETARSLVLKTAWLIDQDQAAIKESSMVKYYATEHLFRAADHAVQIFGGNGLTHEYPLERILRYARLLRIPEGTSEMQLETIASRVGLP